MRYIHFSGGTPYCGCDFDEVEEFPDDTEDSFLDQIAEDKAHDNGESFEYCATGWGEGFESEEEEESYYMDCWCNWEEISEEEYMELLEG